MGADFFLRGLKKKKKKLFKKSELLGKSSSFHSQEKPFGTKCIPKLKELHITKPNGLFQHIWHSCEWVVYSLTPLLDLQGSLWVSCCFVCAAVSCLQGYDYHATQTIAKSESNCYKKCFTYIVIVSSELKVKVS